MGVVLWVKTGENMKHWYAVVDGDLGVQWRCVGLYASLEVMVGGEMKMVGQAQPV
jgi:hypothetical protein